MKLKQIYLTLTIGIIAFSIFPIAETYITPKYPPVHVDILTPMNNKIKSSAPTIIFKNMRPYGPFHLVKITLCPSVVVFVFNYLFWLVANYFIILSYFFHTSTWSAMLVHVSANHEPPSHLPPHTIPLSCPRAPALSALFHASNLHWSSILRMVIYMNSLFYVNHTLIK